MQIYYYCLMNSILLFQLNISKFKNNLNIISHCFPLVGKLNPDKLSVVSAEERSCLLCIYYCFQIGRFWMKVVSASIFHIFKIWMMT